MRYITVFLVLLSVIAHGQDMGDNATELSQANTLLVNEAYQDASVVFVDLFESDTSNLDLARKAALCFQKLGNFKTAKTYYKYFEEIDSIDQFVCKQLASIYELEEDVPKAIKMYTQLIQLDSTKSIYHRKMGQLLSKASLYNEALPYFKSAYALNSEDYFTVSGLAEIYFLKKDSLAADKILWKSLAKDTFHLKYNMLIAKSKYIQKAYDSTFHYLHRIRGKIDFNNYYNKMMGFSCLKIDSIDRAIHYLNQSLINENNPENALYYLGNAYEQKDELDNALHYYNKAIEAGISKNIDNYYNKTYNIYLEQKDYKRAIDHLRKAHDHSSSPLLLFQLGQATDHYYKDKSVAINYFNRYIKSTHDNEQYKRYAQQRVTQLKEIIHLSK